MGLCLLLLGGLVVQQEELVQKAYKHVYVKAAADCERAAALVQTDPKEAVEILTRIVEDEEVKKRECFLRIEILPGTYSKRYSFFLYHYRGLGRMNLAARAADPEGRLRLLRGAESDLAESVRRRYSASKKPLDDVRRLIRAAGPRKDPAPEFRRTWRELLEKGRFAAARAHLEAKGGFLSAQERRDYQAEAERACRTAQTPATQGFLAALERIGHPKEVAALSSPAFARDFALPEKADLIVVTPEYTWCRSVRATLEVARQGKEVLERLFEHAVAAVSLSGPRWCLAAEALAHAPVQEGIERRVATARDAGSAERAKLMAEAKKEAERWGRFELRLRRAAAGKSMPIPARDFASLLRTFPADYPAFDKIEERLRAATESTEPDRILADLEESLRKIRAEGGRYSVESRVRLAGYEVLAAAWRGFLAGKGEKQILDGVRPLAAEWKKRDPSVTFDRFGRKVRRIFQGLQN